MIMDVIEVIGSNKAGTLTFGRHGLRNALFATTNKAGVGGTITCDDDGDCWTRDMDVWLVQGGAFVAAP